MKLGDGLEVGGTGEAVREREVRRHILGAILEAWGRRGTLLTGDGSILGVGRGGVGRGGSGVEQCGGCCAAFGEPGGPGRGNAAGGARIEGGGAGIGAEGPSGVRGDEPLFEVPEDPAGDAAEDRAEGARREGAARVGEVHHLHLPIDDVTAAGSEGAEWQVHRVCGSAGGQIRGTMGAVGSAGGARRREPRAVHLIERRFRKAGDRLGEVLPMCRVRKVSHAILSDGRGFGQCKEATTEGGRDGVSCPGRGSPGRGAPRTHNSSDWPAGKLEAFRKASVWYYIQTIS